MLSQRNEFKLILWISLSKVILIAEKNLTQLELLSCGRIVVL